MAQAALGAAPLRLSSRPCFSSLFSPNPHHFCFISSSPFSSASRRNSPRPPNTLLPEQDPKANNAISPSTKSRNEAKREPLWVASLDEEVLDALMLVKRLGPDVREGKRRQFSYIGKILREAQPELMEALIRASKEGDISSLHFLSGGEPVSTEDDDEEEEDTTYVEEGDELRKLVRQMHSVQEGLLNEESGTENDSKAKKPLIRFLRSLAKQSLAE